jgi:hypothetical protein
MRENRQTIISRRVSRLTLKGMFLMTMAVGIISSSGFMAGDVGGIGAGLMCAVGGEPPDEEKSELLWGDSERLSGVAEFSSHCCSKGSLSDDQDPEILLTVGKPERVAFLSGD